MEPWQGLFTSVLLGDGLCGDTRLDHNHMEDLPEHVDHLHSVIGRNSNVGELACKALLISCSTTLSWTKFVLFVCPSRVLRYFLLDRFPPNLHSRCIKIVRREPPLLVARDASLP